VSRDGQDLLATLREEVEFVGWTETARRSKIDRCSLHRAFRNGTPLFSTVAAVAEAVGMKLEVRRL
jgi:DNA-binding phage protein